MGDKMGEGKLDGPITTDRCHEHIYVTPSSHYSPAFLSRTAQVTFIVGQR